MLMFSLPLAIFPVPLYYGIFVQSIKLEARRYEILVTFFICHLIILEIMFQIPTQFFYGVTPFV
jgi:hypothetical protein